MKTRISLRSLVGTFVGTLVSIAILSGPALAPAQIPEKFTNLKVLPKKTSRDELIPIMRSYSQGLGVRCDFCHAEADPAKGKGLDYPSDAKKEKKIAREMMKMVHQINGKLIPQAGIESPVTVGCVTCHHGVEKPETLADVVKKTLAKDGVPAAETRYQELHDKYYGSGAYDFRPVTLNSVAEWLAREKKDFDGAIAMANFSVSQAPKSSDASTTLGLVQAMKGDTTAAIGSYQHALELDPENHRAQELLKAARGGK